METSDHKTRGEGMLVVIPAYQEEQAIGGVAAEVRQAWPEAQIVVINDGSTDLTAERARQAGAIVLDLPFNLGIGGAVQAGLRYAAQHRFRAAVQVDGDGQHPASEIGRLLEPVLGGHADLAIGSRFLGLDSYRSSTPRRLGIRALSWLIRVLGRNRVLDVTSGFRAFGPAAIGLLAEWYPEDYPEPESILFLSRRGLLVTEVPVRMRERQGGRSSISPGRSIYYFVKVSLALIVDALRTRPSR